MGIAQKKFEIKLNELEKDKLKLLDELGSERSKCQLLKTEIAMKNAEVK